jgi:ribosomal protein L18
MKLHKNKTQKKQAHYIRRKVRTNAVAKVQSYDARVIVRRSLLYISAQVLDQNGNVVTSISDK